MRSLVLLSACLVAVFATLSFQSGASAFSIATSSSGAGSFGPGKVTIETSSPLFEHTVKGGGNGLFVGGTTGATTNVRTIGVGNGIRTSANAFATAYTGPGRYVGSNHGVDFFELPNEATKSYYYHASPDTHTSANAGANAFVEIKPHTHYKVLFIKAPSASASAIARVRAAARTRTQEKTIVYVLSKDTDAEAQALADAAVDTYQSASPEVRFVKYQGEGASAFANAQAHAQAHAASLQAGANSIAIAGSGAGAGAGGRIINSPRFLYNGEVAGGIGSSGSFSSADSFAGVQNAGAASFSAADASAGSNSSQRSYRQSGGVSFGASPTFVEQY